ncbi:DUF4175 family protein [Reichenbachiella agariperforans]|uniref:DUF4175 family protein n=1 Tax=Reichenbachiella agariperforans TaxID=156994 RepID=UPI001C0871BC|nr:DUF4175 family protein [Reichenbachiella agariperforans]MBU2914660.1 hypothetical protein [Reichenbachiella agariperforans]
MNKHTQHTDPKLSSNLLAYKRKLFLNHLIRKTLILAGISLYIYLFINSLEYTFRFDGLGRTSLFFVLILSLLVLLYFLFILPLLQFINPNKYLSNELAAKQLGTLFPELGDKILNTLQLQQNQGDNALINASLIQRTQEISPFSFDTSIDLKQNSKHLKYFLIPSIIIAALLLLIPSFLTESTTRIVNYDKEYNRSLFQIEVISELIAFRNETYNLQLNVMGEAIPDHAFIHSQGQQIKIATDQHTLNYQFAKAQNDFSFYITAGNYHSSTYQVKVISRPEIKHLTIDLDYPNYTGLANVTVINNGNLTVPEGTHGSWNINSVSAEKVEFLSSQDTTNFSSKTPNQFNLSRSIHKEGDYQIRLTNTHSQNKEPIVYHIDIIEDQYPSLKLITVTDTTLYQYLILDGQIADDYGFHKMQVTYQWNGNKTREKISINPSVTNQKFYHQINIDSLHLNQGDELTYYVSIWDNDEIHGFKATRSSTFTFKIPEKSEINADIEKTAAQAKGDMNKALDKAQDIRKQIDDIQEGIKKKNNNWQEKKKLNSLIKDKESLEKEMQQLAEKHKELTNKQNKFHQPNPELQKKAAQLQKIMEDVLDEETKKLYDELKKLLQEQETDKNLDELMEQVAHKEQNLEDEIERALEMFKRMQFEFKMDEVIQDLNELEKEQSKLAKENLNKEKNLDQVKEEQSALDKEFEQIKEEMKAMEELNEELKQPENLENLSQQQESIDQSQKEAQEELDKNNRKQSSGKQQDAAEQMKELRDKMLGMQANMEMKMMQENIDNLRNILDNLITLSFDQERVMDDFREVDQSDPRFVSLSQEQLKLRDDAVIIEDSLKSLASRVFQIQSFVTRELNEMNKNIESSLQGLKDRKKPQALSSQQYTMTAINNLSLLLTDVLQQMQDQMAQSMGMPQKGQKGKKKNTPDMSQLQGELNKKIEQLKKSGKSGRQLSQELAELAAEQEMLRQQLQQMQNGLNQGEEGLSDNLEEIIKKMEQTETDLVNKNIKQETIRRQQDILTRMLQSEDALRERELDQKREAESAKEQDQLSQKKFEEYIKAKESELELLQTLPPKMNPYYKEEVNKYFQSLNQQ